ncbi:hypothetical protein U0039_09955 [Stenotrophomonas maltophilia]|uniref:hypothetical protein n=1 Tax=Stenotrophomonas maltophilia TaxID=40324 RepID=UPI000469F918|nr:hypothetical protein [Stenotrophomonas maltophilia]OMP41145.1 hypothetical protein BMR86_03525 [Stenotrophomonas sp. KAs 5-3]AIL06998.1 hypothetical protein DP16_1937 [Stenotrophomonas maltophilia]OOD14737.1 hypothetical protein BWP19_10405 [Stenotrophomonas maltophilia]QQA84427.1 hypothetical protein I6I01_08555 [Stenotrophomonas maltophilia]WQE25646.1 hypothetical protein U0039_09955 [Stenotrophomonas maltophilia]
MRHLPLPFYCAVIVGLLLALLARAIYTGAESFVLVFLAGTVHFIWCGMRDLWRNWPAFRHEMRRRTAERQRAPMPADDTH